MNPPKLLLFLLPVALLVGLGFYLIGGVGDEGTYIEETGVETLEESSEGIGLETETQESTRVVESKMGRQVLEASFEEEREAPEYERALSGIIGRIVLEEDGEPVPDLPLVMVEVHLDTIVPSIQGLSGLMAGRKPVVIRGRVKTDSEGRFRFKRLHSRAFHVLSIGPGTDKVAFRFLPHGAPVGGDLDLGDIKLAPRGSIVGKLVDEEGRPVIGATVRAMDIPQLIAGFGIANVDPKGTILVAEGDMVAVFDFPAWVQELEKILPFPVTQSQADGSFQLEGVAVGQQTLLVLPKRGLALSKPTRVRAHKVARFRTIKIKLGETLAGKCGDKTGKPVAGVQIRSGERIGPSPFSFLGPAVSSDDKGAFRLTGAGRRANHVVYRRDERSTWIYAGEFRPGDPIRIELPSLGSGKIEVKDGSGKAIENVEFQVGIADEIASIPGFERSVETKGRLFPIEGMPGSWQIKDLEEGKYRVIARSEGYALVAGLLEITATDKQPLRLTLPMAPTYHFEVVDQNQKPVAGARVYWDVGKSRRKTNTRVNRRARLSQPDILLGKTDRQGSLVVKHIEVGASAFSVRHPAYALGTSRKDTLGAEAHYRFVLGEAASVVGQVRDEAKGKKKTFSVMAEPTYNLRRDYGGLMMPRIVATDSEGKFTIDGLTPGKWRFQVLPDFFSPTKVSDFFRLGMAADAMRGQRLEVELYAGQETRVDLQKGQKKQYHGAGIIEGIVTMNGRPRKDVQIRANSDKGSFQAVTDDLGRFRIEGLPESMIRVHASKGDFRNLDRSRLWSGQVDLSKQSSFMLHLDFQTTTALIQLVDPSGEVLPGIGVSLRRKHKVKGTQGGDSSFRGLSDADGLVSIEEVTLGAYALTFDWSARRRGIVLPETNIDIRPGGGPIQVQGRKAIQVSGRIEWVLSHLGPEEKRAFDAHIPKGKTPDNQVWLRFGGDWTQCTKKSGVWSFRFKGLSPGQHTAQGYRNGINWRSDVIQIDRDRQDLIMQMKPSTDQIKRWVRQLQKAENRVKAPKPKSGKK